MSYDWQMARLPDQNGSFNLAIGEPYFLSDLLWFTNVSDTTPGPFTYPLTNGDPDLLEELRRLYPDFHIVICNGAKQGLMAAMAYYKNIGKDSIYHTAPYWPSFPTLAKFAGLEFNPLSIKGNFCSMITSPNNPDGRETIEGKYEILDAVYAHPVYGFTETNIEHDVSVWSASKLFGLSGLRIGWVLTKNADLAKFIENFVESFSSGVCTLSQHHLFDVLKHIRTHGRLDGDLSPKSSYHLARLALLKNGAIFAKLLFDFIQEVEGVPVSGKGMFAFFKPKDFEKFTKALEISKVHLVDGIACGVPNYYRMSMGHRNEYTFNALSKLAQTLKGL